MGPGREWDCSEEEPWLVQQLRWHYLLDKIIVGTRSICALCQCGVDMSVARTTDDSSVLATGTVLRTNSAFGTRGHTLLASFPVVGSKTRCP